MVPTTRVMGCFGQIQPVRGFLTIIQGDMRQSGAVKEVGFGARSEFESCSFNTQPISVYFVPATVLDAWGPAVKKTKI